MNARAVKAAEDDAIWQYLSDLAVLEKCYVTGRNEY
jgi:hypothetical protein